MDKEVLSQIMYERTYSGLVAVDYLKKYIEEYMVNIYAHRYVIFRKLNYLVPNIIYTFESANGYMMQEKLVSNVRDEHVFFDMFIQLCIMYDSIKENDPVPFPFSFENICVLDRKTFYSRNLMDGKYKIRSNMCPVITSFETVGNNKVKAIKSLFTKAVSYHNFLLYGNVSNTPQDVKGKMLQDIFNVKLQSINTNDVIELMLRTVGSEPKFDTYFNQIVVMEKRDVIPDIITTPGIEYARITGKYDFKNDVEHCLNIPQDVNDKYLFCEYLVKVLNTYPQTNEVQNKLLDINSYMITNNVSSSRDMDSEVYDEIFRVSIEPLHERYVNRLLKITQDTNVMAYIGKGETWDAKNLKNKIMESRKDLYTTKYYHWVILKQGIVVGYIGLHPFVDSDVQIRVMVHPYYSNMGIGSDAVKLVLKETTIPYKIVAVVLPENIPSQKMLEKAGMKFSKSSMVYGGELYYVYN